jgi:hypothetical protein
MIQSVERFNYTTEYDARKWGENLIWPVWAAEFG